MPNELLSENVSHGLSFTYQSLGGVVVVMVGGFCSKCLVTAPVTINLFKRTAVNCSKLTKTMGLSLHGKEKKKKKKVCMASFIDTQVKLTSVTGFCSALQIREGDDCSFPAPFFEARSGEKY